MIAPQEAGVSRVGDFHLAKHLAHDDLDVLVVDLDALQAIDFLHFIEQVLLKFLRAADVENFMRNDRTFGELLTFLHEVPLEDDDVLGERDQVLFLRAGVGIGDDQTAFAAHGAANIDNRRRSSRSRRHPWDGELRRAPPRAEDRR